MKNNEYDVIIIGAGIGGLVCGCYLAKYGTKVLIVEKNAHPGGYCTAFQVKGYQFDAFVHSLGNISPGSQLYNLLTDLGIYTINFTESKANCDLKSTTVCFSSSDCDVEVNLFQGYVKKKNVVNYYADTSNDALLLGAIFSESTIYECQVKRLMKKTSELASVFVSKDSILSSKGCSSGLNQELTLYSNITLSMNNSLSLKEIDLYQKEIGRRNDALSCKLF